jgi:glycosyltransferase involved in cell wall biosynthesis
VRHLSFEANTPALSLHTPIDALFLQSQSYFGADSRIHATLMQHFDPSHVRVYAACTTKRHPVKALSARDQLERIPQLAIVPTNFGPSLRHRPLRQIISEGPGALGALIDLMRLARFIKRHNIRIIHCTEKPRDAFYGVLLGRITRARSVVHMHVGYGAWLSPTVKWALRNADALVAVSEFVRSSLVQAGHPDERAYAVRNCLDLSDPIWNRTDDNSIRRKLGIPDGVPCLGIVSRIFFWKGHDDLLDALVIVRKEFPEVRAIVVGEDDRSAHPGRTSYTRELQTKARSLNLEKNVVFTGFRLDVPRVMAGLDIFVMPSWEEPFGLAYLEAMAMEKPVIAWASGGALEVIKDGETGLLVSARSVPALAEAILQLLRDPLLRRRLGRAGRRRVQDVFSPALMCRDMLAVYQATLTRPRASANGPREC